MILKVCARVGVFLILCIQAPASSFLSPVGHRESFLGNAGVGLFGSAGSVLYNPAGMAFTLAPAISLSGSAVTYQEFSSDAFARETGELKSQTLLASGIFSATDKIRMALFYAFPGNVQDFGRIEETAGSTQTNKNFEIERTHSIGGLAYAGFLSSTTSWGLGINIGYKEINRLVYLETINAGSSEVRTQKNREQYTTLILAPGFLWQANSEYSLGATLQWKAADMYSAGHQYVGSLSTGSTTPTESRIGYTPYSDSLLSFTVGQVLMLKNFHKILLDITYAPHSGIRLENADENATLQNVSLGWELPFQVNVDMMTGFSYTAIDDMNFYLLTGGLALKNRSFDGNIGLFLKLADSSNAGSGNSNTLGFLYSSTLEY